MDECSKVARCSSFRLVVVVVIQWTWAGTSSAATAAKDFARHLRYIGLESLSIVISVIVNVRNYLFMYHRSTRSREASRASPLHKHNRKLIVRWMLIKEGLRHRLRTGGVIEFESLVFSTLLFSFINDKCPTVIASFRWTLSLPRRSLTVNY